MTPPQFCRLPSPRWHSQKSPSCDLLSLFFCHLQFVLMCDVWIGSFCWWIYSLSVKGIFWLFENTLDFHHQNKSNHEYKKHSCSAMIFLGYTGRSQKILGFCHANWCRYISALNASPHLVENLSTMPMPAIFMEMF